MSHALNQFTKRLIADAILRALPSTWERRAATLEAARPKPGDYLGNATAEDVAARDRDLAEAAELCRIHAQLLADAEPLLPELEALVDEVLTSEEVPHAA